MLSADEATVMGLIMEFTLKIEEKLVAEGRITPFNIVKLALQ